MSFFQKPIPVLMYHRINRPDPASSLTVSPENFTKQLEWLRRKKFHFLSLDEVIHRNIKSSFLDRSIALTFDDGFHDNYENAFSLLMKRKLPAALFVVVNWVGEKGYLSWKEIRELSQKGILIGSHSLTHRWLPHLSDDRELESEIADSKKRIEDEIGREVRHFSYPVGGVDERVAQFVVRAGYRAAWVAGGRPKVSARNSHFFIRRIKVSPSDSSLFHFSVKAYGIKGLVH